MEWQDIGLSIVKNDIDLLNLLSRNFFQHTVFTAIKALPRQAGDVRINFFQSPV